MIRGHTDPEPEAGRQGDPRWVTRTTIGLAVVISVLPFGPAIIAWRRGWMPMSDWASVVIRAYDSLSSHPPLVGIYSSASTATGRAVRNVYHPGPLQEWLLAVPIHVFAPSTLGILLGSAALVSAAIATTFLVAHRRGGWRSLYLAIIMVSAYIVATGPAMLRDPLHTPLATYAMVAFLASAWAVLDRDEWFWPIAVFFASVAGQAQIAYLIPAVIVFAVVITLRIVESRRRVDETPGGPRRIRVWVTTVIVTLACWAAPLYDQFFGTHNLWFLLGAGSGNKPVGPGWALSELVKMLSIPPAWLSQDLHYSAVVIGGDRVEWRLGAVEWGTALVGGGLVCWALWQAWKRRSRVHGALGVISVSGLAGCFIAMSLMPDDAFGVLGHREIWRAAGLFTWWFITLEVVHALSARTLGLSVRRVERPAAFALGVVVVLTVSTTLARSSPANDAVSVGYGSVEEFTRVATPLCEHGPIIVEPTTLVDAPVALGLTAMLELRGCTVHVVNLDEVLPDDHYRVTGYETIRLTIDGFPVRPPGCRLLSTYDPANAPARFRGFDRALGMLQRSGPEYLFVCLSAPSG